LFFNRLSGSRAIPPVFYGIFIVLQVFLIVLLQIRYKKYREYEKAAHLHEKTEMQRQADMTSLRYKNLLECAGDAIFVISADTGKLEEMNGRGSELFGYSREEMGRLEGKDLIPVSDQPLYTSLVRRIVRHGAAEEECITFKRKDGSRFLGEVSARLIDLCGEKVVQAIVRDVTLKKQEEQDIRNKNRKLAILNSIIARMFAELNLKSEELLRSHRLLEKNSFQLELSRNKLAENLALVENANLELERLGIMKNHFIGMVSHEFRTPLTSILSGTEFLLTNRGSAGDDDVQKLLEMIHKSGARLYEIVSNLLNVVKLEANTTSIARATLFLKDILDLLNEELRPVLQERRQQIILHGVETAPFLCGNREYLVEVFRQLLENAVKFTPDGGEICVTAQVADRASLAEKAAALCCFNHCFYEQMGCKCYMQVEVRDSGIGIDPVEQLKIFDKFYEIGDIRNHSSGKHKFLGKGTGLGLAIVKGMVEAHGGMVWVESQTTGMPEKLGSSFFLLLPLEEDAGQVEFPFMDTEGVR